MIAVGIPYKNYDVRNIAQNRSWTSDTEILLSKHVSSLTLNTTMTGIFTYKNFALSDTPRLDTKVAVVTVCFSLASLFSSLPMFKV